MNGLLKACAIMGALLLAGCANYYQVTDTRTGDVYFTRDIDRSRSGAVEFVDARSDVRFALKESEVRVIDRTTFKDNVD